MGELFKKFTWLRIVIATLLLAAGVVIFVLALVNVDSLGVIFSIVTAVILFLAGGLSIFAGLFLEERKFFSGTFAYAAFVIAIGVLLCVAPHFLESVFILFFGILLCVVGGTALIKGIVSAVYKDKKSWIIASFVIGLVAITLGVLLLVYQTRTELKMVLYICLGVIVFGIGLYSLIDGIKKISKKEKVQE